VVAVLGVAFGVCADTPARPVACLVVYVDDASTGSERVLGKLRESVARLGTPAAAACRIELAAAGDLSDQRSIEVVLRDALARRPAAIVASNSNVATVARSLTRDVPIIFASHQDPIAVGLARSLARPGGNLTGYTYFVPVDSKRLELLRQVSPRARRLGIVIDRWWLDESGGRAAIRAAREDLGFEVELFQAESGAELDAVVATPRAKSIDAWYVPYTRLAYEQPDAIVGDLGALRRPVVYPTTRFVQQGGLLAYEQLLPMDEAIGLLATALGLVLDGVPPGDIPIERPKAFRLAVNVEAARALGIEVPEGMLKRAERVIGQ